MWFSSSFDRSSEFWSLNALKELNSNCFKLRTNVTAHTAPQKWLLTMLAVRKLVCLLFNSGYIMNLIDRIWMKSITAEITSLGDWDWTEACFYGHVCCTTVRDLSGSSLRAQVMRASLILIFRNSLVTLAYLFCFRAAHFSTPDIY